MGQSGAWELSLDSTVATDVPAILTDDELIKFLWDYGGAERQEI